MATSRTGTARWKRIVREVKREARAAGITRCPRCPRVLDYDAHGTPNSVEVDHIVPHELGGRDDKSNARVLCRTCNRQLGALLMHAKRGHGGKSPGKTPAKKFVTATRW